MAGIILVMAGLLLSAIDIRIIDITAYPEYTMIYDDLSLGEVIQKYVAGNMYGETLRFDIMSDMLGYVCMFIGACMLVKYNARFLKVLFPLLLTAGLYVFVNAIPFVFTGKDLIVYGLAFSFIQLVVELFMERMLVYTIAKSTSKLPNQRDTVLMKFGWVGSALCRSFLYFIVLVGLADWIIIVYMVVQAVFMVFCLDRMFRCRHYLN